MLIHFSTDQILLTKGADRELVPFENIERVFPRVLHEWYTTYTPSRIAVINGPGSFTQLRVATIACNILTLSQTSKIDFLDISKISLYHYAMQQSLLPPVGVIFMGQRKKMWVLDGEEPILVDHAGVLELIGEREYFIDWMFGDHPVSDVLDRKMMLRKFTLQDSLVSFEYATKKISLDVTDMGKIVSQLEPRYMMEPKIG